MKACAALSTYSLPGYLAEDDGRLVFRIHSQMLLYTLKHVHVGRQTRHSSKFIQVDVRFHVLIPGMQTGRKRTRIFNAPPPRSPSSTSLLRETHTHTGDTATSFCVRGAFVVSFLSLCKVHGSCSSLNRAGSVSQETQPLVVKSRDAHGFTDS